MEAIVLAAGKGVRMHLDYPKQFMKIGGKPCFIYVLEALNSCPQIETVYVTCNKDYMDEYREYARMYDIRNTCFVEGGATRQESVYKALQHVKSDKVLIHEAARPLISVEFIEEIISHEDEDAVIPTVPLTFTVAQGDDYMTGETDRSKLHNIQLPQMFTVSKLRAAHEAAIADGYTATEDGMLAFHYGVKVRFVPGRDSNIKITTPFDIHIVEKLLKL